MTDWVRVEVTETSATVEPVIEERVVEVTEATTPDVVVTLPGPQGVPGPAGAQGPAGEAGPQGDPGEAATVYIGNVTTASAGTNASVVNTGSASAAVLDFVIPQGAQGVQGAQGPAGQQGLQGQQGLPGEAATVAVGTVYTGLPGSSAIVTNVGNASAAVFDFTLPQGATGATGATGPQGIQGIQGIQGVQGEQGDPGPAGQAATIAVGTVYTGIPGSSAAVTNVGTSASAVLEFTIPQGPVGPQGPAGTAAPAQLRVVECISDNTTVTTLSASAGILEADVVLVLDSDPDGARGTVVLPHPSNWPDQSLTVVGNDMGPSIGYYDPNGIMPELFTGASTLNTLGALSDTDLTGTVNITFEDFAAPSGVIAWAIPNDLTDPLTGVTCIDTQVTGSYSDVILGFTVVDENFTPVPGDLGVIGANGGNPTYFFSENLVAPQNHYVIFYVFATGGSPTPPTSFTFDQLNLEIASGRYVGFDNDKLGLGELEPTLGNFTHAFFDTPNQVGKALRIFSDGTKLFTEKVPLRSEFINVVLTPIGGPLDVTNTVLYAFNETNEALLNHENRIDTLEITGGTPGEAATIDVGTVYTGGAGSGASVINIGNASAAVFDFYIPEGAQGDPGTPGENALWNFTGAYDIGAAYAIGDVATYDGQTWYRIDANGGNTGDTPVEGTFWTLISAKGDQGLQGDSGVAAATLPITYDSFTQTIGASVGTSASTVAAGDDPRFDIASNLVEATKEPIGHFDKTQSTMSFDNASRTLTISPTGSTYEVWCAGTKYDLTTQQVTIPNLTDLYYISFTDGVLGYSTSFFVWDTQTPTAYIYWNQSTGKAEFFADERHGTTMDWATHEYLHRTRGAVLASGFDLSGYTAGGNGSSNSHAQIGLNGGTFFDEDNQIDIVADATPTANTFEQDLASPAKIPVFYRANGAWKADTATSYPLQQGLARPTYNLNTAGTWTTPDVANNRYFVSWIVATNNLGNPVLAIMGQADYTNVGNAEAVNWEDLDLTDLPIVEIRPLYKLIFQASDSFSNDPNAALVSVQDLRAFSAVGAGQFVSDHGQLSGLADDDHTQYHTDARGDLRYAPITHASTHGNGGSDEIAIDASQITSGIIPSTYLGTGTASSATFLRGDGTYATPAGGAGGIESSLIDAKGDLIVGTANDTAARLPVGATNGHVLTVDSTKAEGMTWAASSGGASVPVLAPLAYDGSNNLYLNQGGLSLNASVVASGTLSTARMASGTASFATYPSGSGAWTPSFYHADAAAGIYRSCILPYAHQAGFTIGSNTQNTLATTSVTPIFVGESTTFDRVGVYLQTPATDTGSYVEFGYCPTNSDGLPDMPNAVSLGTQEITAAANIREVTINLSLNAGLYWLLTAVRNTNGTFAGTNPAFYAVLTPYSPNAIQMASNNLSYNVIVNRSSNAAVTSYTSVGVSTVASTRYIRTGLRVASYP
jgi:hypothetical protein